MYNGLDDKYDLMSFWGLGVGDAGGRAGPASDVRGRAELAPPAHGRCTATWTGVKIDRTGFAFPYWWGGHC